VPKHRLAHAQPLILDAATLHAHRALWRTTPATKRYGDTPFRPTVAEHAPFEALSTISNTNTCYCAGTYRLPLRDGRAVPVIPSVALRRSQAQSCMQMLAIK
jgi:hypothetical protein